MVEVGKNVQGLAGGRAQESLLMDWPWDVRKGVYSRITARFWPEQLKKWTFHFVRGVCLRYLSLRCLLEMLSRQLLTTIWNSRMRFRWEV